MSRVLAGRAKMVAQTLKGCGRDREGNGCVLQGVGGSLGDQRKQRPHNGLTVFGS
jgi:hypothetical protein